MVPMLQSKVEAMAEMAKEAGHAVLRQIEPFLAIVMQQHSKTDPWQSSPSLVAYHDALLRRFGTHGFGGVSRRGGRGRVPYIALLNTPVLVFVLNRVLI